MAQIDRAGFADGQCFRAGRRLSRCSLKCDMPASPAGSSSRAISKCKPAHIASGRPILRRRRTGTASAAREPREVTFTRQGRNPCFSFGSSGLAGKAEIDVPAGIAGIVRMREAHRKSTAEIPRAHASGRLPTSWSKAAWSRGGVHRFPKRLLPVIAEPDHRPRPGFCIIGITTKCRATG